MTNNDRIVQDKCGDKYFDFFGREDILSTSVCEFKKLPSSLIPFFPKGFTIKEFSLIPFRSFSTAVYAVDMTVVIGMRDLYKEFKLDILPDQLEDVNITNFHSLRSMCIGDFACLKNSFHNDIKNDEIELSYFISTAKPENLLRMLRFIAKYKSVFDMLDERSED
jgi:hypothetical protein